MRGTFVEPFFIVIGLIGVSMPPVFWLGEVVGAVADRSTRAFSWVPPLGFTPITSNTGCGSASRFPVADAAVLGFYGRVLRSSLVETRTGLRAHRALQGHHGAPRALPPRPPAHLDHLVRQPARAQASGRARRRRRALLTEVVFGLPGVGELGLQLAQTLDLPVVHGDRHVRVVLRRRRERGRRRDRAARSGCAFVAQPLLEVRGLSNSLHHPQRRGQGGRGRVVLPHARRDAGRGRRVPGQGKSMTGLSIIAAYPRTRRARSWRARCCLRASTFCSRWATECARARQRSR